MLLMDAYSKWPEVHMMESTITEVLIKHLQQIFATYGIPQLIVSDNGPQFVAEKFKHYCMSWGIQHITTVPYHPRSNGEAERLVQAFKNYIDKADPRTVTGLGCQFLSRLPSNHTFSH